MTVQQIYDQIDLFAPFDTQVDDDNSGLIIGSSSQEVNTVLFALDVTDAVIDEALSLGAGLIITHHPLMFQPVHSMTDEDYEGRLIRRLVHENISLIAAHTNLDQACGGVNDILAGLCGLRGCKGEGFFRCGYLPEPETARSYADRLKELLHTEVRLMGPPSAVIQKVGLCSGGGSSEWKAAVDSGCDAFISGEIRHHHALAIADSGMVGLECGHFATEEPGIRALAAALQNRMNTVKYNLRFYLSGVSAYSFPGSRGRR